MEDLPVINIGDRIKVHWPNDDGSTEKVRAHVTGIEKCKKAKQNSLYKYTISIESADDAEPTESIERSTRLLHLKWKKISSYKKMRDDDESALQIDENMSSKKRLKESKDRSIDIVISKSSKSSSSIATLASRSAKKNVLPAHSRIVAPMVGGSELAFRLLCRYVFHVFFFSCYTSS